jgi:aminoglycoside phosphotransferase (APT) family kinase protein
VGVALDSAVRRIAMASHSGSGFTQWLERRLDRWRLLGTAPRGARAALVHGSFQLRHVVWAEKPVILGWDLAGIGDPEEDLGAMAARLYWDQGDQAAARFAALRRGYDSAGGTVDPELFEHYAGLAMVRVLAIHALREPDQARLRSGQDRWSAWPEVVKGW